MLRALRIPSYRRLFAAQVISLLGTGLATIALGLTAYSLDGEAAGAMLGLIFTVKMVAYVGVAPVATALLGRVPRQTLLVASDAVRALAALALILARDLPTILLLVFVLQSSSATFTPAFQGVIPHVVEDEEDYTNALSLSRLAYEVESIVSPMAAAALLVVFHANHLFLGTSLGFIASALLVISAAIPREVGVGEATDGEASMRRILRGSELFVRTPELRPVLALNLVSAAAVAFLLVQTVVIVQSSLGLGESWVAVYLAFQGAGSIGAALVLPRFLRSRRPLAVVLPAGAVLAALTLAVAGVLAWRPAGLPVVIAVLWLLIGIAWSALETPLALIIRRAVPDGLLTEAFAGQFSLSHACWLLAYPTVGLIGAVSLPLAAVVSGTTAAVALGAAVLLARRVTP